MYIFLLCIFSLPIIISTENHTQGEHTCGRPLGTEFVLKSDRIVAGYDVGYYRYPWYAALIRQKQVSCGGALIGPKTILTAAHCFREFLETNKSTIKLEDVYTVKLGLYNICTSEPTVTEFKVQKVQVHELYLSKKPYFDICLLTLTNSTEKYHPICLPSATLTKKPKEGTVPGMGTLKYQGPMPCTLHEARLLIYPDDECRKMIKTTGNNDTAMKNAFCAGYMTGGTDTCQGDSGGPLQILDENGNFVLIGIVSFGFHCAVPGYLGLYTDTSQYINWIKEKSGLDLNFLHSLAHNDSSAPHHQYFNNSDESVESSESGPKKKKKHLNHEHPYKAPIRIIILRDSGLVSVKKSMVHYPVKRRNKNPT
ncbi:proclotting enzyme-like [Sitophilus oryzae]|uniref:Proclotting enzyme-like n=1 Tax=Sitophilus oryzae TaxID=7048 RepID=A0A6J2XY55_SITOR|nr:proclotting enzyme-like [Sitophilus oryzae]